MLKTEYPYRGRSDRIKHYSDAGMMILQIETGVEYREAIDLYPCKYTYEETNTPVPAPPEPQPEDELEEIN